MGDIQHPQNLNYYGLLNHHHHYHYYFQLVYIVSNHFPIKDHFFMKVFIQIYV